MWKLEDRDRPLLPGGAGYPAAGAAFHGDYDCSSVPFSFPGKLTNENISSNKYPKMKPELRIENKTLFNDDNDQSNYEMGFPPFFNDSQFSSTQSYTEILTFGVPDP